MGLDIYSGPVTRYVAGDWMTIVQQSGAAIGVPVEIRPNEQADAIHDTSVVEVAVAEWQGRLLQSLDVADATWTDTADEPYSTDKPDWDGYGAVVLLAASQERPDLAPGARFRRGLLRKTVPTVLPRQFPEAEVFKAASSAPTTFPTLLARAEWCLPISSGPTVFQAATPNGTPLTMGRVEKLLEELHSLNDQTLQLSPADLADARSVGPPPPRAPVDEVAPFGLAVLIALADFALVNSAAWIMDY